MCLRARRMWLVGTATTDADVPRARNDVHNLVGVQLTDADVSHNCSEARSAIVAVILIGMTHAQIISVNLQVTADDGGPQVLVTAQFVTRRQSIKYILAKNKISYNQRWCK